MRSERVSLFFAPPPTSGTDSLWPWLRQFQEAYICVPYDAVLTYTNGRLTHVNGWNLWK